MFKSSHVVASSVKGEHHAIEVSRKRLKYEKPVLSKVWLFHSVQSKSNGDLLKSFKTLNTVLTNFQQN